jgi:hypothetical protein
MHVDLELDELNTARQSCIDEGLLTSAWGKGNLRITKKGRQYVKYNALADEEVEAALKEAIRTPWLERRSALVSLVLVARLRSDAPAASGE